jgi:two-component system chemotaxis response regulator CheY
MTRYSALIIDDDIWMQRILSKTLQSYGFKTIFLASNGFEGVDHAVENKPDIIILDILMPELSGHLTLKILKHIQRTKNIPVLMVSALSDTENLGLAVKSGTAGFVSKPFTRATVYEKLAIIFGKDKLDAIIKGESVQLNASMADTDIDQFRMRDSNDEPNNNITMEDYRTDLIEDKSNLDNIRKFLSKVRK